MIYTSYFGAMKNFNNNMIPFSIAQWNPKWYKGNYIKALAPQELLIKWWKSCEQTEENRKLYIDKYIEQNLKNKDPHKLKEILDIACEGQIPVLLCYERPDEFCHRQLVREWLNAAGIECEEYKG